MSAGRAEVHNSIRLHPEPEPGRADVGYAAT